MARPKKDQLEGSIEQTAETLQELAAVAPAPPAKPKKPEIPRWAMCVVNVDMANRPSTHPVNRQGNEGYCISASVISIGRIVKNTPDAIYKINRVVNWRLSGRPNHNVFYLPADKVHEGMRLNPICEWIPQYHMGQIVGYNFELNFNL